MKDICSTNNPFKNSYNMQRKFMKRYLIKNSFLLFVIYMLSSIMLISIYDNASLSVVGIRSLSIGVFAFLVFFTNANIIIYFKTRKLKDSNFKNVEKKIFISGYIITLCLFALQHFLAFNIMKFGVPMHLPRLFMEVDGWKALPLAAYVSLMQYTFIYLIQNFTLSQYEKNMIEVQLLKLKTSNAETTNQLLKQQIQPHFLFNALNTLKSLIRKDATVAEDYLISLSDFLRASFTNHKNGLANIATELEICSNYMEMQKMRFGNTINYIVTERVLQSNSNDYLPVFSLQPLIDNAIKHNIATAMEPLNISIDRNEEYVWVTNNLQVKKSIENSTGNGISNLKERYRIISGDEVEIINDGNSFTVRIKVLTK